MPTLEEIREERIKRFSDDMKRMVDEKAGSEWIQFVEKLEDEGYDSKVLAASLCAKLSEKNKKLVAVKNISKMDSLGSGKDRVWLNFDIGSNDSVNANYIIGAIVRATGLPTKAVGKIYIFSDYVNVSVSPEHANLIIKTMANIKMKQRTVHVTIASKAREQACERSFNYREKRYGSDNRRQRSFNGGQRGAKSTYKNYKNK